MSGRGITNGIPKAKLIAVENARKKLFDRLLSVKQYGPFLQGVKVRQDGKLEICLKHGITPENVPVELKRERVRGYKVYIRESSGLGSLHAFKKNY